MEGMTQRSIHNLMASKLLAVFLMLTFLSACSGTAKGTATANVPAAATVTSQPTMAPSPTA